MNRYLALVLLVLLVLGLLHSLYAFAQGRFAEALIMYPLLIACYVFLVAGKKWRQRSDDSPGQVDHGDDGPPAPRH